MNSKFFAIVVLGLFLAGCNPANSSNPSVNSDAGSVTQGAPAAQTLASFQQEAMMLLAQGKVPEAVEVLRKSTELFPQDDTAYYTLAQIYMKIGSFDNAVAACQKAIEKNPDNGHAYLLMAGCYDLKNDSEKAMDLVKMSIAVFGKQNDTANVEAASAVLQKLVSRSAEAASGKKK